MPPTITAPSFRVPAFTCTHCHTMSQMDWADLYAHNFQFHISGILRCTCTNCNNFSLWSYDPESTNGVLIFPLAVVAPDCSPDLPVDCRLDFEEARQICGKSPRGAAALLRLCLQKLLVHLGGAGKNIDDDIKTLVSKGLDPHIQQALDVVRVTGNNAVHPLEMNLEDDEDSVLVLFDMINLIVEERISRPKNIQNRFANLPEKARLAIEKRDKPRV